MLVISVLSVNTIYSASLLSQKGSLQAKLPLMLVGAVCLLTSRAEKKVDSKTLQDPYSALCLNWIWVALCLLQSALELFTTVRLRCYSLHVTIF